MQLLQRAYGLGRTAFLVIVVLGALSIAGLSVALIRENDHIEEQQSAIQVHFQLIEDALLANCRTRDVIEALSNETVTLLRLQPPSPENDRAIIEFATYAKALKNDVACRELQKHVNETH